MSRETEKILLPADIPEILGKYGDLFCNYTQLPSKDSIYGNYKRTNHKLSVLFPLIEHPVHGKTGLHATEKYEDGFVIEYHYQWKIIIPKMGKLYHIFRHGKMSHTINHGQRRNTKLNQNLTTIIMYLVTGASERKIGTS
ncbi:hypothetical protein [Lentibacillus salinarum]|uniref:Uncharacterized protein n=1 Tax=Lentibacillus salinarum TaxID=446820 RepID=A0ABW3ZY63_9BACI